MCLELSTSLKYDIMTAVTEDYCILWCDAVYLCYTMKMEAAHHCETSVNPYQTTRYRILIFPTRVI